MTQNRLTLLSLPAVAALTICVALMIGLRIPDTVSTFLLASLPVIAGGSALVLYAARSQTPYAFAAALLYYTIRLFSIALQVYLKSSSVLYLMLINLLSVIFACGALFAYQFFLSRYLHSRHNYLAAIYLTTGAICLFFILLFLFGSKINGARLWIQIGSFSFQLSELIKLTYYLLLYLIVNSERSTRFKLLYIFAVMGMCTLGFLVLNEAGTLLLLGIVTLLVIFLFLRTRTAVILIASVAAVFGLALWVIMTQHDLTADKTDIVSRMINKIYDRLINADPYQQNAMFRAIANGSFFGAPGMGYYVDLDAAATSDLVLASVTQHFGALIAILIILMSAAAQIMVFFAAEDHDITNSCDYKLGLIASVALSVPMIITALSNSGFFPIIGVNYSLLGSGGSQCCLDATLAVLVVSGIRHVTKPVSLSDLKASFLHYTKKGRFLDDET